MPTPRTRRLVEIDAQKHRLLKERAKDTGKKMYAVIDDILETGMKRRGLVLEGDDSTASAETIGK